MKVGIPCIAHDRGRLTHYDQNEIILRDHYIRRQTGQIHPPSHLDTNSPTRFDDRRLLTTFLFFFSFFTFVPAGEAKSVSVGEFLFEREMGGARRELNSTSNVNLSGKVAVISV